jgi:hypothetical protein
LERTQTSESLHVRRTEELAYWLCTDRECFITSSCAFRSRFWIFVWPFPTHISTSYKYQKSMWAAIFNPEAASY